MSILKPSPPPPKTPPPPPSPPKSKATLTSLLRKVRAKALAGQAVFTEAVWKDPAGRRVKCGKIHEVESDFLDRARARGVPAVLLAPYGTGKALPTDAPVLTPSGWVANGDLKVGDRVMNPDGGEARVVQVFDFPEKDLYRVTFTDGGSVECCEDHLWAIHRPKQRAVWPLSRIVQAGLKTAGGTNKRYIPVVKRLDFKAKQLPLDPYVLGALLGDGTLGPTIRLTSADPEIVDVLRERLPRGVHVVQNDEINFSISRDGPGANPVTEAVKRLGLLGTRSGTKFIPAEYMLGSHEQRLDLLRGLCDTDGAASEAGVDYVSTSKQLALDVQALVRSLGGLASLSEKQPTSQNKDAVCALAYRLYIRLPAGVQPFLLARKRVKQKMKYRAPSRAFEKVEFSRRAPARCLLLDSDNHLYVTKDYIVTHNTEGGLSYCLRLLSEKPDTRLGIVCDKDEHAIDRAQTLLRYIEADEDYQRLFPEIAVDHGQRGRRTLYKFRLKQTKGKDAAVEASGIFASGTGSRKDVFFFDDVVTKQNAINEPAQRPRIKQSFFGTWLSRLEPGSWWFYIGTTYHADDLTTALRESPDFAVLVIGVSEDFKCYEVEERWPDSPKDAEGRPVAQKYTIPLWEPKWSEINYRKRYAEMAASGDTLEWMTGYRNLVVDPSKASFKEFWFHRKFEIKQAPKDYAFRVMFADPATTTKKRSDYYAGWVLGWDPQLNAAVAIDGWYVKEGLSQRVETYLSRVERWAPHRCGIEGRHEISFSERIEEVALDKQLGMKLLRLDREIDKDARIGALAPVLEAGRILVDASKFPWIVPEAQLWPNAKHDDALDCLEGAWQLIRAWLRRGHRVPKTFDLSGQYAIDARSPSRPHFPPVRKTASEECFGW